MGKNVRSGLVALIMGLGVLAVAACGSPDKIDSRLDSIVEASQASAISRVRIDGNNVLAAVQTVHGHQSWTTDWRDKPEVTSEFRSANQFGANPTVEIDRAWENMGCDQIDYANVSWVPKERQVTTVYCEDGEIYIQLEGDALSDLDVTSPAGLGELLEEVKLVANGAAVQSIQMSETTTSGSGIQVVLGEEDVKDVEGNSCKSWVYIRQYDLFSVYAACHEKGFGGPPIPVEQIDVDTVFDVLDQFSDDDDVAVGEFEWSLKTDNETGCLTVTLTGQDPNKPAVTYDVPGSCATAG